MSDAKQPIYLVFGGELKHVGDTEFNDPSQLHVVGMFGDRAQAHEAWSAMARATIDDAQMRYFMIDISTLLKPHSTEG